MEGTMNFLSNISPNYRNITKNEKKNENKKKRKQKINKQKILNIHF